MQELDPILPKIKKFIAKNDIAPTMFGLHAAGDANLIDDLERGRELRRATRRKIAEYMEGFKRV